MAGLFDFVWRVAEHGYHVVRGTPRGTEAADGQHPLVLAERPPVTCFGDRLYYPLEEKPALFRTFIATDPTPDSVERFAVEHGMLTTGSEFAVQGVVLSGELFSTWEYQLGRMKLAAEFHDALYHGNRAGLQRLLAWKQDPATGAPVVACTALEDPDLVVRPSKLGFPITTGDLATPARALLHQLVNKELRNNVQPALLHEKGGLRSALRITPVNLIGCIWLQLAEAISGTKQYRQCVQCQKWFEVGGPRKRTDRELCSAACKNRAYRDRMQRALELHAAGKRPADIARELNAEVASIKKWITASKRKG